MGQSIGCSTLAPRSGAAKQWFEELTEKKENKEAFNIDEK